jgi:hypothetical protein
VAYNTSYSPSKAEFTVRFMVVSCSPCSSTPKMEATCPLETSVDFQHIVWCYIPEHGIARNHRCDSFKSYIYFFFSFSNSYVLSDTFG